jgi:hypothetical protein
MPVGRLSFRHALIGGATATLLWEMMRHILAWYYTTMSQIQLVCVPKTLSELMPGWNRLSWRNDGAALFRSGRPGLAIQVEVAASG